MHGDWTRQESEEEGRERHYPFHYENGASVCPARTYLESKRQRPRHTMREWHMEILQLLVLVLWPSFSLEETSNAIPDSDFPSEASELHLKWQFLSLQLN